MDYKLLFNFALKTGVVMLENGAETYRVEDTIERILRTSNFEVIETFVTPTGIIVSFDDSTIEMISRVKRVRHRTLHLHKVSEANNISRQFCKGEINLNDAWDEIKAVEVSTLYSPRTVIVATGLASGFFSLMFGSSITDFFVSVIIGTLYAIIKYMLNQNKVSPYFCSLFGGLFIGFFGKFTTVYLLPNTHFDLIIIGSIMPLVPGVAITNGIMDTIRGDLVSGISRSVDAIVTASFLAIGVGIGLEILLG